MPQMTAVQVSGPRGLFETVKRPVPEPGPHTVRIKIEACGVCHSDVFVKEGHWPGLQYPGSRAMKSPVSSMPLDRL